MQSSILNRNRTYFIYPDGMILAYPLSSASHQWNAMMYHLKNDRVFQNQQIAENYIRSTVSYLVTFPLSTVVSTMFKYPTPHKELVSNFQKRVWEKIRLPSGQPLPVAQAHIVFGLIQMLASKPQPDRFLSDRISMDHPFFNDHIKNHILHRKVLAIVMSLLPGAHVEKMGEIQWQCALEAIADDKVSPKGFPERFLKEIRIGPQAHTHIIRRLQQDALEHAFKASQAASAPASAPLSLSEIIQTEKAETAEIMNEVFGTPSDPQALRPIHSESYKSLQDIPSDLLGELGQPLYVMKRSRTNPDQPKQLYGYLFPRLNLESPASPRWKFPQSAAVWVPVNMEPLNAEELAALHLPSAALEPEPQPEPEPSGGGLLDELWDEPAPERQEEPDPFANFSSQSEDYDAWVMQLNTNQPVADDQPVQDDAPGPAKRARPAQA